MNTQINEIQNTNEQSDKRRKINNNMSRTPKLSNLEVKLYQMYIQSEHFELGEYEAHLKTVQTLIAEKLLIVDDSELENYNTCTVDFAIFLNNQKSQTIFNLFRQRAKLALACLKFQIHKFYIELNQIEELNMSDIEELKPIDIRLVKHKPYCSFSEIKSSFIHRLVTIKGTVIRASSIRPLVVQMAFDCAKCRATQVVHFLDGKYTRPTKCNTRGCASKSFEANRSSPQTVTVDSQSLKIQENTNDNSNDLGRVPRTVNCELSNSLVDKVTPGDMVACTGLVKAHQASGERFAQKAANTIYTVYLDLLNISKTSGTKEDTDDPGSQDAEQNSKESIKFSDKDLKFVNALFKEPDLFKLIVNSFCPKIYGHELVKAGVLLSLFGGRRRNTLKRGDISIRGDSHVLIVGDPGLGKSQILMAAKNLAPRGVYVCGTSGVSSSGLTVTLTKEAGSNDFALEAGALVLGDQGTCCIDEFDKMTHEHSSLLEAMEQQSISIAKGGIVCTLPARTSIVAAANPAGGHYNKAKTVSENLKMNSALLSRFDLLFILLDKPNQIRDHYLSKHIMQIHSGRPSDQSNAKENTYEEIPEFESSNSELYLRLHRRPGEKMDLVPGQMLRKYIAYARTHCQPYLSPKAGAALKEFYIELRKKHQSIDSTPITTRQLESLIRLAEARAKMELRETVTEADAQDVIELMKHSLFDTYEDEVGNMDFSRSQNGTGMSKRETVKVFLRKLSSLSAEYQNKIFSIAKLRNVAEELKLKFPTGFGDFIEDLNNQGYLLKKGTKTYELSFGSVE